MAMERTPGDRNRRRPAWLAAVGVATALAALLPFTPLGPTASAEDQLATQTTPDEVRLVVDDPGAALIAAQDPDVDLARLTPELGVITTSPDKVDDAAAAAFAAGAITVERDVEVDLASFIPTDPGWTAWWGARQLRLEDAWPTTLGSGAVDIAIVDTGINLVPELAGRVLPGWSAFADQPSTLDGSSSLHGTKAAMVAVALRLLLKAEIELAVAPTDIVVAAINNAYDRVRAAADAAVADLEEGGYIAREKVGRSNRYRVLDRLPLRHPIEAHRTIGDLLDLIAAAAH
jgi:DNA-binding transcriptional ArsR family regulator